MFKAVANVLKKKILVLDGAMGTQIQKFKLKNKHYTMRTKANKLQRGNNDLLNVSQPALIEKIHADYAEAQADIIETNTFSSNPISQADYFTEIGCDELNRNGVLIAKRAGLKHSFKHNRRVFTAGSVGPTNKTASISPDVSKPSYRSTSFDELALAYEAQMECMLLNKVDIIALETIFDTLNAKAAIYAYHKLCLKTKTKHPIIISATVSDNSSRTLSGQTIEAFWNSIKHAKPLSVGLNCALGADKLKAHVLALATIADVPVCAYPNAGLPNEFGEYSETPIQFASKMEDYVKTNLVNIIGGCCGSTPAHIAALKPIAGSAKPRRIVVQKAMLRLSGINAVAIPRSGFCKIGERANVAGSSRFREIISKGDNEGALEVVREQVASGANVIDVNMDEPLLNSKTKMKEFVNLIESEPDVSKVPLMIDSSDWATLTAGARCTQGRCIINSISLKDGEHSFLEKAQEVLMCGGVPVTIAFDEQGQADTCEKRLQICKRAHKLLTRKIGYSEEEVVFDLNTFAIATGIREHNSNAIELIKAIKLVTKLYPKANISIGVSNLSFSFRGSSSIRESIHSVFLNYAAKAGLNMGIVNVNKQISVNNLSSSVSSLCTKLVLNTKEFSVDEVVATFGKQSLVKSKPFSETWRHWKLHSKITYAVVNGIERFVENDSTELALQVYPISVIEGPLMEGMNTVGKLFETGKMFLPQVVKSARVMKKAVLALAPLLRNTGVQAQHTILLATVKGDVHDIGKNIVGTILSCNNYKIVDLGIMTPADEIIKAAKAASASIIGLSGLITPSLNEMVNVASKLQESNIKIPLLIGGAATSKTHTAIKIFPKYTSCIVIHVANASKAVNTVSKLLAKNKAEYIESIKSEYKLITTIYTKSKLEENKIQHEQSINFKPKLEQKQIKTPSFVGAKLSLTNKMADVTSCVNWKPCSESLNKTKLQLANVVETKLAKALAKLVKTLVKEQWISTRSYTAIREANASNQSIIVLNEVCKPVCKLQMLRQQLKNSCHLSLSDFVNKSQDYVSAYCCSTGYESTLIQRHLKKTNKHHLANTFKTICDKIVEECSLQVFNNLRNYFWGFVDSSSQSLKEGEKSGIRPAPGYPICPDHHIKLNLMRLLKSKQKTGLLTNSRYSMSPQSSVVAMVMSNKNSTYFSVKSVNADQIEAYSKSMTLSTNQTEKNLSSVISYLPSYIER
ncbi:methionine synthase [Candidatus Hodgkinia cicadicola]